MCVFVYIFSPNEATDGRICQVCLCLPQHFARTGLAEMIEKHVVYIDSSLSAHYCNLSKCYKSVNTAVCDIDVTWEFIPNISKAKPFLSYVSPVCLFFVRSLNHKKSNAFDSLRSVC